MRSSRLFTPFVAAALVLGACSDDGVTGSDDGKTQLTVLLTDAPGDLAEANIQIEKIILIGGDDEDGRVEFTPQVTSFIDLLDLTGGQTLNILDAAEIEEGTFSELRIVLGDAFVVLSDGRVFATAGADLPAGMTADGTLRCPSCSSSGFKVKFDEGGLSILEDAVILLDFDAAQSFGHEAGQSGQWIMHPVLRATAQTVRLGRITGTVTLAQGVTLPATCGGAAASITQFVPNAVLGTTTLTGTVAADGTFTITGIFPGTYVPGFVSQVTFTNGQKLTFVATPSITSAVVGEAQIVTVNYVITSVTCT